MFVRFQTPSQMSPEELEAIFVQREVLAQRLVDKITESTTTASKHHALLVGPRGIGKTHLVSLVHHRVVVRDDVGSRLAVAWLREEAYSVASYAHLLLAVLRALEGPEGDFDENAALAQLNNAESGLMEARAEEMVLSAIGDRTLLLITENLNDTFASIGKEGQQKLRAFVQNHPRFTILATTQGLFAGVSLRDSPFYGFFEVHHLDRFSFEEALQMLQKIAERKGDQELVRLLQRPKGRARVRAIDHLAAGSPRIYVILSEFLSVESIDELAEPVLKMIENLTPYYQSRMQMISPQQRALVEYLCDRAAAVTVSEIARGALLTPQTTSSQLKKLRDLGYVRSHRVGRESYYELQEPLMRIALSAKRQRGKPFRLFVDFLRCWYTESELQIRAEARSDSPSTLNALYAMEALQMLRASSEDPRWAASSQDYEHFLKTADHPRAIAAAEEMVEIGRKGADWIALATAHREAGDYEAMLKTCNDALNELPDDADVYFHKGVAFGLLERVEEALTAFKNALRRRQEFPAAQVNIGIALERLGRTPDALAAFEEALRRWPGYPAAHFYKGAALGRLGRGAEALAEFDEALQVQPEFPEAHLRRGVALGLLNRQEEALVAFEHALRQRPNYPEAHFNKGISLSRLKRAQEALEAFEHALRQRPKNPAAHYSRGAALLKLGRVHKALGAFEEALRLRPEYPEASIARADALGNLGRDEESLSEVEAVLRRDPGNAKAHLSRGVVLGRKKHYEKALAEFDEALHLRPEYEHAHFNRGLALRVLGRNQEAVRAFDESSRLGRDGPETYLNKGLALARLERLEEAVRAFDRSAVSQSHAIDSQFPAALCELAMGRVASAARRVKSLLEDFAVDQISSGLVAGIHSLQAAPFTDAIRSEWLRLWRDATGEQEQYQTALRMLAAAVEYLNTGDRAALLDLPAEERSIVAPLVDWAEAREGS